MAEKSVTLTLPATLTAELRTLDQEFLLDLLERGLVQLKIERALRRYVQGGISFAAAAALAGVSQSDLARQAYARGMEPPFSPTTVQEELDNSEGTG
ncbi:MAG: antitoxin [Anaerolineae bacterium]|nr:antitoxin [Anaerolineae bacterium]